MKKVILIIVTLNSYVFTSGQIQKLEISDPKEIPVAKYDSTSNFVGKNYIQLIGQELYLLGVDGGVGYQGFTTDLKFNSDDKGNVYKPTNKNSPFTKYQEVAEKYYTVLEVLSHPKLKDSKFLYGHIYFLKLQEKVSGDILYYRYEPDYEFKFPFIIVGYYLKQKQSFFGKQYVVRGRNWNDYGKNTPITDIKSGLPVSEFKIGSIWTIVDISIKAAKDEYSYAYSKNVVLILENSIKEKIQMPIDAVKWEWALFEKEIADKYKQKFGDEIWQKILESKIWLNMTDVMCKLSWGTPNDINKTVTATSKSEQWVYKNKVYTPGDHYLYFTDGILTAMQ